ncbi:Phosphoglycerate mutase family protein [Thermobacillus xylanilyticus]|mgnify:CR=1 FL=1|jgi:2,3-bisphosphoglycerate-dependent phosphoglycerate mutase|uniref:Phosphoglycerate mutase family protein n=1 Tax=Thermobacillus xylanilyticus TaxID=76633 RepID=A0ABN7S4U4_THEXY|nr:histidine phosphatase family protein [Thermobacillus xylanilyticus]CAG5092235.1 Phosphoglycerate mutase family protein [Thermobacillus xylanilyticus]
MKTTLYMVRHAESPYVHGQERTRGLSAEGWKAAARVAEIFAEIEMHVMVSSPYARARQTIQRIAKDKGLEIAEYEELAERLIAGPDRHEPWDVVKEAIRRSFDDKDFALEGGESTRKAQRRAIPVILKLLAEHRGRTIVVGTHGNIMTIILNFFDNRYGYAFWEASTQPDVYRLTFEGERLESVERIWTPAQA